MKRHILTIFISAVALTAFPHQSCSRNPVDLTSDPVEYVSTLVGTLSEFSLSTGNTYPATALPWGMNFWTPQTGPNGDGWTYSYAKHLIRGFKQTHQPSPWINDYGEFSIMPVNDREKVNHNERASWFSHNSETAKPYLYSVYLADHDIRAEIAPADRAAYLQFTYPESETSAVVVDAYDKGSEIEVIDNRTVVGYTTRNHGGVPENFHNWFVISFDKDIESYALYDEDTEIDGAKITGEHALASLHFKTRRGEKVGLKVASSFISPEQAMLNLREVAGSSFEQVKEEARNRWNEVLGVVKLGGGTVDQYRTFYSCLYRSVLFPRKFYEIDASGKPVHYSPYDGQIHDGYLYTDTGFWDTFRSLFPLLNLLYPSVNAEIQQGLANVAKESGFLPEWASPGHRGCMIGNNSASIVADAYVLVLIEKEIETLYSTIVYGTDHRHPEVYSTGREGHEYYNKLGYIPYDVGIKENVARTLEYAYDDWCILQIAKKIGAPEADLAKWTARAGNYKNVYDASSRLMRGRNEDGTFQEPFSPYKWGDAFTEGNSWHYTWSVMHDVQGLIDLMGGEDSFVEMLDSVFVVPPIYDDSYYGIRIHEITEMQVADMGNYAHGNQPAQHIIYLYNYAGAPWKAQMHVRDVMERLYSANPDGYCGDEDNGQTSAWYVFSALGFYPVCPASGELVLGSPLFPYAEVQLENGRKFTIVAQDNSKENIYIGNMSLNGKNCTRNYVTYSDLKAGANIRFNMTASPVMTRGTDEADKPYSFSRE